MNTLGHANRCCCPLTILQATAFIVSSGLLSTTCRSVAAQEASSGKPQKTVETRKTSPSTPDEAQTVEQLVNQILGLENKLLQLSQREPSESTNAAIASAIDALAKSRTTTGLGKKPELEAQAQQLQQMKEQLAEREKQMATLAKQMMEQHRQQPLPPLENGQLKVFSLIAVPARAAGQTIESLFGSQVLRIAVDERSNSLIVYGKPDSLGAVEVLLGRLDESAAATPGSEKSKQSAAAAPRSLLLRVFWLADNLREGVGQKPADFLPDSVIRAATKLGLEAPRLVTQTVNSIALGREDAVDFSASVPAVLFDQPVGLNSQGRIKFASDDRVRLEMGVHVGGPAINCELNGSLATPLGHYMVLGTANSIMAEGGPAAGAMGGAGMMGPGGQEGGELGAARSGQPFRGRANPNQGPGGFGRAEGAAGPGAVPGAQPGGPGAGEQRPKQYFNTSRFAFVVQVIEGQSYPAEKDKSGSK